MDYLEQREAKLEEKRKKLAKAVKSKQFKESGSGELVLDFLNEQISRDLNKAFGQEPLTYEQYLSTHGKVKAMQLLIAQIDGSAEQEASLQEEVKLDEQAIKDIREGNTPNR